MNRIFNRNYTLVPLLLGILLLSASTALAQKTEKINANARGTSTQLGKVISVDFWIREYSDQEERAALLEAFTEKGSQGLVNALDKMKSKGRIAITGTLGFDVNFIRSVNLPDGSRMIRFVTDRPITFAENWASSRSADYQVSMGEIILRKEKGKSTGKLFPAAKVKLNKDNEIEIETFQNPWDLTNIRFSN